jgi:DNA-binding response OmpR family regulator
MGSIKKIFCVEDNKDIAHLLQIQLENIGYQLCGIADNTKDAVAGIGKSNPDIVLVDIELHGKLDGLEIGKYLGSKTNIPFIYLSGHDDPKILEKARKTIPTGYLMKPFGNQELKVALELVQFLGEKLN